MKEKLCKIIKNDGRIVVAVDGKLPSIALLDMAVNELGENAIGFYVVTDKTTVEQKSLLNSLKKAYPIVVLEIDWKKFNSIDTSTDIGKSKALSILLQKIMHKANIKGFATVYSGVTADDKNTYKTTVLNCLQVVAPFVEVNAKAEDIKASFSNVMDNL